MKIGINGFGRIGRQVFRIAFEQEGIEIVHINDLTDAQNLAYLLQYDTTHGSWKQKVKGEGGVLQINGESISISAIKNPAELPWKEKNVDVVLESTGQFLRKEEADLHLAAGAKKVLVSAPGKNSLDGDFIIGVNDEKYISAKHNIISIGSCTTNCLAPVAKVIHDEFKIEYGLINTIHAYTASQSLLDGPSKKLRRGRAAAENLIPTTTGAASTIGLILPELEGKLDGLAVRAPIKCGSVLDFTCTVKKKTDIEKINQTLKIYAEGPMKGILAVEDEEIVSGDVIGNPHSAIVSSHDTQVLGGHLVKILAFYDNEWGFSSRCVDMMRKMLP